MGLEYCPGGELYDQIHKRGKLPLEVAAFYAAEIVLILQYLESKQVRVRGCPVGFGHAHWCSLLLLQLARHSGTMVLRSVSCFDTFTLVFGAFSLP